ncbi:MAG: D-alanyl-D-alanine carboxypeptidase [Clostridia bacterium]|nr:D-alanyl-D-alanine carboxypeptidase [Clostridia bacterium]
MKKIFVKLSAVIFLISINLNSILAHTNNLNHNVEELKITSKAGIIMEQSTGRVLWEKNSREKVKIASTTKILTAIVAVENASLEDKVNISKKAALTGGSTVGVISNTEVSLRNLLYGLLLKSGNDCAVAIAEYVGGSVEKFVELMNKKAYEIGAKDTYCTNPHGLDTENNYSTAYDIAKITCYAKGIDILSKIMSTESITLNFGKTSKFLANTNRLLFTYEYCDGGKTGYTALANRCLVATARKDNLGIVAVVLGADTTDIRFKEGKELLKYGIENYKMVDVKEKINWYIDIPIIKGDAEAYVEKINLKVMLPLKEGEEEEIYISENIVPVLTAPVEKGVLIGKIGLNIDSEILFEKDVYTKYSIRKKDIKDYLVLELKSIFQNKYIT